MKEGIYVPKELLDYLEQQFPDRCPTTTTTDREVWIAVGAVKVVHALRNLHKRQVRNAME